jgi:ATP-dependent Clp protease ATP-binding subunit ClpB
MASKPNVSISDILVRGTDVLNSFTNFQLVGRDLELAELTTVLMKMRKNNLIVTGRGGVGITAIVIGIQALKKDHRTPVDIVGKRFFWLNSDKLFESGSSQVINDLFEKVRNTLLKSSNSVLVVEDTIDFIRGAQNNGCTNLINGMMGDLKAGKYQAIFETKDDNLGEVLKCDGDILECCTLIEVKEPSAENLRIILKEAVQSLERHHGIGISPSALEAAAMLTEKYKLPELRAQPDAAISLLDRALTDYCRLAHVNPRHIEVLRAEQRSFELAIGGEKIKDELRNLSDDILKSKLIDVTKKIEEEVLKWEQRQRDVRLLYKDISDGEEEVRKLEDSVDRLRVENLQKAQQVEHTSAMQSANAGLQKVAALSSTMANANFDTPEISGLKSRIQKLEELVRDSTENYKRKVAEIYAGLSIDDSSVLTSFSAISGIPVDTLSENERIKLKNLEHLLSSRVIGQTEPTIEVAKSVKRARLGLKMPNKPSGTFMFLGPSGVGKTELAKTLAEALQVPLLRFDMSEYMEKHAIAKLIGAPPGYEGYEHGGILTNAARKNPYSVVLFDEIEKAHVDVFNLMLQVLDDARLTDSRGLTASFKDCIIIMTTNIGTTHFLNDEIAFEDSKELAFADLREQYRPEFLGRFGGNIYCFQRLDQTVLSTIARKDIDRINSLVTEHKIEITISDQDLKALIDAKYVPREGARSVLGYIDRNITSGLADLVLGDKLVTGTVVVTFDVQAQRVSFGSS